MSLRETVNNPFSYWMRGGAPEGDVVISSRIRVARNLAQYPFPHLLSQEQADQVIHAVGLAVNNAEVKKKVGGLELVRLSELSPVERQILVEKHLISPDLLEKYEKKAVALREDEVLSVMVNEEDHLRIQCLMPGLQLHEAWKLVDRLDDGLEKTLDYAFSEQLGYLTACPTNVGTGLRASVMVHLPGLVMTDQLKAVLLNISKLGFTVRGLYGEGTEATGNLFQLSNQITLGHTEEEIIQNLIAITAQLINQERAARQAVYQGRREQLEDRIWRAYGTLKNARMISSDETMKLLSQVRLGVDLGIIRDISPERITELMVLTRPAFLIKLAGRDMTAMQRDVFRAELIRNRLS